MRRRQKFAPSRAAFTLIELLVVIVLIAIIAGLAMAGIQELQNAGKKAASTSNLRQFAAATHLYLADHNNTFFPYRQLQRDHSVLWWFGAETQSSLGSAEGQRHIDKTLSPLFPYLQQSGKVEVCPGFAADKNITKSKYDGASYGYGYNVLLGGGWMGTAPLEHISNLEHPANTIFFATCAQVNTFQAPASPDHPLIEEFFGLDDQFKTIDFRFAERALVLFGDGHVEPREMYPGTADERTQPPRIGRVTPVGSMEMLK